MRLPRTPQCVYDNVLRYLANEFAFGAQEHKVWLEMNAVEMAKKYSTEESGKFVNGILGTYLRAHPRTKGAAGGAGVPARTEGIEEIVSGEVQ